jgi:CRP-like cAMP-binding protein/HEAT repeat protein
MVESASQHRSLARLILDPDAGVRRAAIQAAASVPDARLAPLLADALGEKALGAAAAKALTAIGEGALPELARRLADPRAARAARLRIPRVLWRIGTTAALAVLMSRLDEEDEVVRQKVLASASRLRLLLRAPPAPLPEVRSRIDRELHDHEQTRDDYLAVRPLITQPLLEEHLLGRLRKGLIRILRLCELAYPREVVASVRAHLFGSEPALRANAFEVLESMLEPTVRVRLVALVERFLALRAGDFTPSTRSGGTRAAAEWVRVEIEHADPWRAVLALDATAHHRLAAAGGAVMRAAGHPDGLVREAAAIAAAAAKPAGYRELLERLLRDPDPIVARYATYWAQTGRTGIDEEDQVYTTVEKVLFLQRVPVFSRVSGDDLVSLARGSVVVPCQPREVIFREGDRGGALYFVISGSVSLSVAGREVARLGPNDVFGEMSIFDREPRAATAMVVEEAELLRVSAEEFHEAVRETVEIAEAVIQVLNRRLREADRRLSQARSSRVPSIAPPSLPTAAAAAAAVTAPETPAAAADGGDGAALPALEPRWEGEPPSQEMIDADLE